MKTHLSTKGKTAIIFILAFTSLLINSCQSDLNKLSIENELSDVITPMNFTEFDWETATYVPTPPGVTQIPLPWNATNLGKYEPNFNSDYSRQDGWELVASTFNYNELPSNKYFILYNKYRGVVRAFIYAEQSSVVGSEYMVYSIGFNNTVINSPIYNFHANGIIDYDAPVSREVSQVIPFRVTQTASWYGAEFEVAYDENMSGYDGNANRMVWSLLNYNISNATLGGSATGTIDGTITRPVTKENIFTRVGNTLVNAALNAKTLGVYGIFNNIITNDTAREGVNEAIAKGSAGIVGNFLNGILGSKGTEESTVDLKINMDLQLQGTITNSPAPINDPTYPFPGSNMTNVNPIIIPTYNTPLGVFYISDKPTVKLHRTRMLQKIDGIIVIEGEHAIYDFTIDRNSFNYNFNTHLQQEAIIEIEQENIIVDESINIFDPIQSSYAKEIVGSKTVYGLPSGGVLLGTVPDRVVESYYNDNGLIKVRSVIKVTPNNGMKPTKIIKTFLANVELETSVDYYETP